MRAQLHDRAGAYVESGGPQAIERNLDLLAYHYWLGEDDDKKRDYALRAGIAAQTGYANDAAAEYFQRALPSCRRRTSRRASSTRKGARSARRMG